MLFIFFLNLHSFKTLRCHSMPPPSDPTHNWELNWFCPWITDCAF
uniref:Uncharacterized protein n=1 Tax=Anguilla anguilla TaxID=7936 RepID=A0A0E9Q5P2_ANGAN